VFAFILGAVWTPPGIVNSFFCVVAAACVVIFASYGNWTRAELGLTRPLAGATGTLVAGIFLCAAIALIGIPLRFVDPGYVLPWTQSMQYVIWSLAQEFILQSVFFLRLEAVFGSRKAVVAAAFLFALAHIPNPILTILSFWGGLLFCESFRRWRNLFPLGIVHAALGLTIAASLPDKWLHHMRVGIGYLTLHH
jgi:membrane protease YdiL (CAAX protease family)